MRIFTVFSIFSSLVLSGNLNPLTTLFNFIICNFKLKNFFIGTIYVVVVVVVAAMHLHKTRKISDVLNF